MKYIKTLLASSLLLAACQIYGMDTSLSKMSAAEMERLAQAIEPGDCKTLNFVGDLYFAKSQKTMDLQEKDAFLKKAEELYLKAAQNNNPVAFFNLGNCYSIYSRIASTNEKKNCCMLIAMVWFRLAADQGLAHAQTGLGGAYYEKSKTALTPESEEILFELAMYWTLKAIAQNDKIAATNAGVFNNEKSKKTENLDEKEKYEDKAIQYLTNASQLGHKGAALIIAAIYLEKSKRAGADGVTRSAPMLYLDQAIDWYRRALEKGGLGALGLGACYYEKSLLTIGISEKIELLDKALLWGKRGVVEENYDPRAVTNVGLAYLRKSEIVCDSNDKNINLQEAIKCLLVAAKKGNREAQSALGSTFYGMALEANNETASKYLDQAIDWCKRALGQIIDDKKKMGKDYNCFGNCLFLISRLTKVPQEEKTFLEQAAGYFEEAIKYKCEEAKNNLGACWFKRSAIEADPLEKRKYEKRAKHYLKQSKEEGLLLAQMNLNNVRTITDVCIRCREMAKKLCGNCKVVRYCTAECQRDDWAEHQLVCNKDSV